jgi:hypothetical protein
VIPAAGDVNLRIFRIASGSLLGMPLVTLARRDEGHARHIGGDGAVDRRRRQGVGSRLGGLFLLALLSPTGALQALQALHKCSRLHSKYKV